MAQARKAVTYRFPVELLERISEIAPSRGMTKTEWVEAALNSAIVQIDYPETFLSIGLPPPLDARLTEISEAFGEDRALLIVRAVRAMVDAHGFPPERDSGVEPSEAKEVWLAPDEQMPDDSFSAQLVSGEPRPEGVLTNVSDDAPDPAEEAEMRAAYERSKNSDELLERAAELEAEGMPNAVAQRIAAAECKSPEAGRAYLAAEYADEIRDRDRPGK